MNPATGQRMISPAQLRAARGMLDWTRSVLAKASKISPETIKNIENGIYTPQDTTVEALVRAFSEEDIEFTENDGVKKSTETVSIFHGKEGFCRFMDDVYASAQSQEAQVGGKKQICVSNVDDRLFVQYLGSYAQEHVHRMNKLRNVKVRVLTNERDFYKAPASHYIEYRWSGYEGATNVPFYVYGSKLAVLVLKETTPRIVVIRSPLVADAYREQFDIMWDVAKKRAPLSES